MLFKPTWDIVVKPEEPISFDDLEVRVSPGESLNLGPGGPTIQTQILTDYNTRVAEELKCRLGEITATLEREGETAFQEIVGDTVGALSSLPLRGNDDRFELKKEILQYWNQKVAEGLKLRLPALNEALNKKDEALSQNDEALSKECEATFNRLMRFTAGNGPKHRFSRASLDGNTLYLALGGTDYMHSIGTNERSIADPDFRARLMKAGLEDAANPHKYFADPLAVCSAIYGRNPDGEVYVPVGLRSDMVMIYPGVHHIFGGMVDVDEDKMKVDLGGNSRRELREEMGLTSEEMSVGELYSIVRQGPSRIPEAVCGIQVFVDQKELEARWRESAPGKFEHRNLSFYTLDQLPGFLREYGPTMVPSGAAALTMLLEHHGRE